MVEPTRVAWAAGTNAGAATLTLSNPTGAQAGDRIVAFISHTGAGATITNLQGWTLVSTLTFNTRRWHILERTHATSYPALTLSTGEGMLWATVAIRAADGYQLGATVLGTTWRRVDNGGSINTTQAPSVAAAANTLALAFFSETSTAAEAEAGATLTGSDWSKWFWSKAAAGDANPINFLAYRPMPDAGATGTPVVTYKTAADATIPSQNGAGVQLLIPQTAIGPAPTGNLDTTGVFQNSATHLTVGARQLTSGAVAAVLRQGGVETARQAMSFVSGRGSVMFTGLPPGTAYTVTFEVDGVAQTDVGAAGRTLRTGPSSFKWITGSCMATGSTHPVFDAIAAETADFWTIQGDAHYEDQATAAGWWAGMVAGLNAWRGLTRKLVTRWTPDNHDTIRTSPLGGGAPELPPIWKQIAGANGWASDDSVGQAWQSGRVLFIQADLRSARHNYQTDPAPLQMLGAAQEAWFTGLLDAAEVDPSVAIVVWFDNWIGLQQSSGRWGSYPDAYARLNTRIQASTWLKKHLILVGGDSHNLWADSGARSWPEAAFPGVPSLNISGYNKASPAETFFVPDLANDTLIASGVEADWGGYSRMSVTDDGTTLTLLWEGVRVNAAGASDVMASWSKTLVDNVERTAAGTLALTATAPRTVDTSRASSGALGITAIAPRSVSSERSTAAELAIVGTASRSLDTLRTATGSLILTGEGQLEGGSVIRTAAGILELHSSADRSVDTARTVASSLSIEGSAERSVDTARTAVGALQLAGAALTPETPPGPVEPNGYSTDPRVPDPWGRAFDAEPEFVSLDHAANWE